MLKNAFFFFFHVKNSSFSRYLNFCPDIFGSVGKWLDKKAKNNSKIYDVTDWETNNYNTLIAQYLKKERQPDNEIWSANRI